jgi:hypothetical protein
MAPRLKALPKTPYRDMTPEQKQRRAEITRRSLLKKLYKLSPEDYDEMLCRQNGLCAVCKTDDAGGRHGSGTFMVDHDHGTGRVRALVCTRCNLVIGALGDDAALARRIADYLETHVTTAPKEAACDH